MVALFSDTGHMLQQVRYDPYGVPFGISKADINADGVLDSSDSSLFVTLYNSGSGTHPFADWNLDGTLNSQDPIAFLNSYNADTALGYGVLGYGFSRAGGANRKAYAGYEIDPVLTGANGRESIYHVRHRVLLSEIGRWNRRDPLGYVDGMSLYGYLRTNPLTKQDPLGLEEPPNKSYFLCTAMCEFRYPHDLFMREACIAGCSVKERDKCRSWAAKEQQDQSWLDALPSCPCTLMDIPPGEFTEPAPPSCCHPGAAKCIRSTIASESDCPSGQQCCYDAKGNLITDGDGAGTPDKTAPNGPICTKKHYDDDVKPYTWCRDGSELDTYRKARPPNNGNKCPPNKVP